MEIHPSSMVVLPEEEEGVLNVLELVTRQADGKFGNASASVESLRITPFNSSAATNSSENTVRTSSTADGNSTAVGTKFTEELPEIQRLGGACR